MSDDAYELPPMCVTPDGLCETGDGPPDADSSTTRDTQGEALKGQARHAGNADAQWTAVTSFPDLCQVGDKIVGFDSTAPLGNPVNYSPNVVTAGQRTYREGDLCQGTEGNAGAGIVSGTSQGSGHVLFLTGQDNVKVNGQPVVHDGSECMINCSAAGAGGAQGYVHTNTASVNSQPEETSEPLSEAALLQQQADANRERVGDLRDALNDNPNGKTAAEAQALNTEIQQVIEDARAQQDALMEAMRQGKVQGDDVLDTMMNVDEAAQQAVGLQQEAERQVQFSSDAGRKVRQVGDFAAEVLVTPYGMAKDAWEVGQQVLNKNYMAAAGVTALALVSIIPGVRWFRRSNVDDIPKHGGGQGSGRQSGHREPDQNNEGLRVEQPYRSANFADDAKLQQHFEKHGAEFGVRSKDEYLLMARDTMHGGDRVQYTYKGELRTGFVQFMGNNRKGQSKFAFVGTNSQGQITTLHTKSGKDVWKTLNGNAQDKTIYPVQ